MKRSTNAKDGGDEGVLRTARGTAFFAACAAAISRRQYKDALLILRKGLADSLKSSRPIKGEQFISTLDAVAALLEFRLEEDFGEKWQRPKLPQEELEASCSFCMRPRSEVSQIIAGGRVYICDQCVRECYEVISQKAKPRRIRTSRKRRLS